VVQILFSRILSTTTHQPLIMYTILQKKQSYKEEQQVRCPHCATSLTICYGNYKRAHPEKPIQVDIQRYLCKFPDCQWKTFSVLPHPFLPIIRHFYHTLLLCHLLCNIKKMTQVAVSRQLGLSRGIIKRLSAFSHRFSPWFHREKKIADWGPAPDTNPTRFWPEFCRDFSQSFYQKRWLIILPTQ
jgi:hypothetical protein